MFGYYVSFHIHGSYKHQAKALAFTSFSPPHKYKLNEGCENNPHKSETREKCATSKSKPQIALLVLKPNTSERVEPLPFITHQEL